LSGYAMRAPVSGFLEQMSVGLHKGILAAPDRFAGYARLAGALRKADHFAAADQALRRARVLCPDDPRLLVNAANLWLSTGLPGAPLRALYRALCVDPEFAPAADRLVLLKKALGDRDGAIRVAEWGIRRPPGARAGALLELALMVFEAGDAARARRLLGAALPEVVRSRTDPRTLFRLAKRAGGSALLIRVVRMLLCESPIGAAAARELARTPVDDISQWPSRAMLPRLSLALPMDPVVHNGSGVFLEHGGRAEEAPRRYAKAAILDPALSIAIFNLGVQSRYAGNFARATQLFERALAIGPDDPIYRYNLGQVLLATGRTERGLALYEERWRSGQRQSHRRGGPDPSFPQPVLKDRATDNGDEPILIWGEQGLGDEIWFAGYVPRLFQGRRAVLECDSRLTELFRRSELARTVVARVDPPNREAVGARRQIAAGSLPLLASGRASRPVTPAPNGYLRVNRSRADTLRARLAETATGPTIGISWRSRKPNPIHSFDAPLQFWKPVLDLPNASFVNLQYDATPGELDDIGARHGIRLINFADIDPLRDIDDVAALVSVLDHVVSIANVNVALCHGIGRGCHVALRHYQEDWRYQRDRTESPWLPECRLYWPERENGWERVFARIAETLRFGGGGIAKDPGC
jgi:tetratricopeptide (TPR) repeat protein